MIKRVRESIVEIDVWTKTSSPDGDAASRGVVLDPESFHAVPVPR